MDRLDLHSRDFTQNNVSVLAALFPNCVTESPTADGLLKKAIDFDQLRQELAEFIVEGPQERYQLNWPGKREALLTANAPIAKTLRPCRTESVDFDTTQNLYIEGDNLDALKLLQETYLGKVKMIYIDPPYNTGNDFIYEDDFVQDTASYLLSSNQKDDAGNRMVANSEANGRFHSDWLSMMYPRLKLARNLLRDDGVIFISIDSNEQANLKRLCDEIFGNDNFIENYIWESTFRPDNSSKIFRENAQYIVAFAKNIRSITRLLGSQDGSDGLPSLTKSSMKESILEFYENEVETLLSNGIYKAGKLNSGYELLNDVLVKDGLITNNFKLKGRVIWGQNYLREQIANGTKIIIKTNGFVPYTKKVQDGILAPNTLIPTDKVSDVLAGRSELCTLMDSPVFSYPKPISLINYFQNFFEQKEYIILDFFSGSSTTAHAVMQLNADDGGNRKFIMVQLPEVCDEKSEAYKAGYSTIAEIGKERIRRAGQKIKQDNVNKDGIDKLDIGFRVLKTDSSNMKDVYYTPDQLQQSLLEEFTDNIKADRTPEDLLFQVLLDWGVDLTLPITQETIAGKTVLFVDDNALAACFDADINETFVKQLATHYPLRVVFRDAGFASDSVKINIEQIFKLLSPSTEIKTI